ncbi:MAG: cysteinyl-tRNA synthetase [Vezdaea aestivalis]|nr:MAG: cysteinyl-tRNA synthetase [Vezdaea aestivalis]
MVRRDDAQKGAADGSTASSSARGVRQSLFGRASNVQVKTDKKKQPSLEREDSSTVSPTSNAVAYHNSPASISSNVSPKNQHPGDFANHRRELAKLDSYSAHPPPPSKPFDWASMVDSSTVMTSSAFPENSFNDSTDNFGTQMAARAGGGNGQGSSRMPDDRRPSLASLTTVSSGGSKSSAGRVFHKKNLTGIFGDEYTPTPQASDTSLPGRVAGDGSEQSYRTHRRDRNESTNTAASTEAWAGSRPGSRPHTPVPSNAVVPFLYQDPDDLSQYGDAPVRHSPQGPDKQRYTHMENRNITSAPASHAHLSSHFPFGHHRNKKPKDSAPNQPNVDKSLPPKPDQYWPDPFDGPAARTPSTTSSASKLGLRSESPTPSGSSMSNREPVQSQRSPGPKKSFFQKFREKAHLTESDQSSKTPLSKSHRPSKGDSSINGNGVRQGSVAGADLGKTDTAPPSKKGKFFGGRKGGASDSSVSKEAPKPEGGTGLLWTIDNNFDDMTGIVAKPHELSPDGGIFTGSEAIDSTEPGKILDQVDAQADSQKASWNAPDSWRVQTLEDETMSRLRDLDEDGAALKEVDDGVRYSIRVFRVEGTFATLTASLKDTAAELLSNLGKKSFLQASLDSYQLVMRKHDMQRVLDKNERPVAIQKRLLNQAGYTDQDRLDEVGREDNSYLVRFTFVPSKLSGYYSLEKDPGISRLTKFSRIDLSNRNLIAIPITLYQKATEIVMLNLSRNLSLDLPKDFITSCVNLRDIKYTANEAERLPLSLSLASRLTFLDVSNNRLEQLEHANLEKLRHLISLKMSNNRLTKLPDSFKSFTDLRTLNVSSNFISEFPEFICSLTSLQHLDISFNVIRKLPENVRKLVNLETLAATNNCFTGPFPDSFASFEKLKEIDMRYNALTNINVCSQLPLLEQLSVTHNQISSFKGSFYKLRSLTLSHNPVTSFVLEAPVPTMTKLNIGYAKLSEFKGNLFERMPNLESLILDKNHIPSLPQQIGRLQKLEHLSLARNPLQSLPAEIGCLQRLRVLDAREANLRKLPPEIWCMTHLDTLNLSSNVLETFPKPATRQPNMPADTELPPNSRQNTQATPQLSSTPSFEELGKLEDFGARRPSQASAGLLSVGSSPGGGSQRNNSIVSVYGPGGRKASVYSRTASSETMTPIARKDSNLSAKDVSITFASSLKHLYLADNRLNDDCFDNLVTLKELRTLNLSYNEIYDLPQDCLQRWPHLTELYLSGNELTSFPVEDLDERCCLRVLHLNGNRFQTLPAELGKLHKLSVLDCGGNSLKYNVSNWPYDWNWNKNPNLKYLNLSGNKRLEIKPQPQHNTGHEKEDLTGFTSLHHLRVLGLMDVTLTIPTVPDQTEDRRVRTSGSLAGNLTYGMADSLGRNEHLSTIDMVVPRFRGEEVEALLGMFDGQALTSGGSKVAKFLHENFGYHFNEELGRLSIENRETPADALRRTFLALNKDLATAASLNLNERPSHLMHRGSVATGAFTSDDLQSGGVATVLYLSGLDLYVANVGDAQAMLLQSDGGFKMLTRRHDPAMDPERGRIREAGGYVSVKGKLNDHLDVSRAFGYIDHMPAVQASPHVLSLSVGDQDEMVVLASKEFWEYVTPELACDVARYDRGDLMRASQKLRDLAIAFGATQKLMVMMVGISDLKRKEKNRLRGQSLSMGPTGNADEQLFPVRSTNKRRPRDAPADASLARLEAEVPAPTGDIAIVFTDIKSSTALWELGQSMMRTAVRMHNDIMRRQLRIIGGFEVKTEGDAFMVSFPTATSALLWCFSVQSQLLDIQWPQEILDSEQGREILDMDGNTIYRGLSVRMGIHWGGPVCEEDPVTRRMDYFGPMVNRASRISGEADGGQITVSSDFIQEIQRCLETYSENERSNSVGSASTVSLSDEDPRAACITRELRSLSTQGFEVKDLGERKLKGLENPEFIYLMYPHILAGRLSFKKKQAEREAEMKRIAEQPGALAADSQLLLDTENVWKLWRIALRLEMICSGLEGSEAGELKAPEMSLVERIKNKGGQLEDKFLVSLLEHQVSRIETCTTALLLRNLVQPFNPQLSLLGSACPMADIFAKLKADLTELEGYRAEARGRQRGRVLTPTSEVDDDVDDDEDVV